MYKYFFAFIQLIMFFIVLLILVRDKSENRLGKQDKAWWNEKGWNAKGGEMKEMEMAEPKLMLITYQEPRNKFIYIFVYSFVLPFSSS